MKPPGLPSRLDWLGVLLASWALPVACVEWAKSHHYMWSLTFWAIPITLLGYRAVVVAQPHPDSGLGYSRRRRGLYWALGYILGAGVLLDFAFGRWVLQFDRRETYVYVFDFGAWYIPIEEVLFYALAPVAVVLVYAWCDEYWLERYGGLTARRGIVPGQALVKLWLQPAAIGLAVLAAGLAYNRSFTDRAGLPVYFVFLVFIALVPVILLYRAVRDYVNWAAFGATTLYVIATSVLWEATLGVPFKWWGYRPDNILGPTVKAWTRDARLWPFPIEAAFVWVCAPFSCILIYEFAKAREYARAR